MKLKLIADGISKIRHISKIGLVYSFATRFFLSYSVFILFYLCFLIFFSDFTEVLNLVFTFVSTMM